MCDNTAFFCGCQRWEDSDDTTAPSESGAAVDAVTDMSTEPSSERRLSPRRPASDAVRRVTDISRNPGQVNTTTPSVRKPEWKKDGKYTCGKNLAAGEYYVVPNSKKCFPYAYRRQKDGTSLN